MATPALTTINQPIQEMGQRAVGRCWSQLPGRRAAASAMHISLETRLVVAAVRRRPPADGTADSGMSAGP